MTRLGLRLFLFLSICATIGCDRVTKQIAATTLAGTPGHSFLADTFRLEYAENAGAFLGLGAAWPREVQIALFVVGNGLGLLAVALMVASLRWRGLGLLGVSLFVAGGVSNLADRVTYGKVIDFMNVGIGPLRTGIFNVADVAIMIGAAIVLLVAYRAGQDRHRFAR